MSDSTTKWDIEKDVLKMNADANLGFDDKEIKIAILMLSAFHVGPINDRLIKFTGYPRKFVEKVGRNLRKAGIWKTGRGLGALGNCKITCDWDHEEHGTIQFVMDVMIGAGKIEKVEGDKYQNKEKKNAKHDRSTGRHSGDPARHTKGQGGLGQSDNKSPETPHV